LPFDVVSEEIAVNAKAIEADIEVLPQEVREKRRTSGSEFEILTTLRDLAPSAQ